MAMWVFSSPGTAALEEPGGGYPGHRWASPPSPAHSSSSRPVTPARSQAVARAKRGKKCRLGGCHCPVPPTTASLPKIRVYPSPEMKAAASSGALQCWLKPVLLWRGAASPCPAQPNLLLLGPSVGHKPPCASIALYPSCHQVTYLQLCRHCWGTPARAPPGTATSSCLLQMFCPERVNISFPEPRITFLRVGFWTFY